jgi:4-amino-4-deoxy-L-arabinose transferase-like glycosyltransferase
LYWFSERYVSRRAAAIAGICLATSPLFIGTGREAITDMPLSLFIAGALMAFYHGFQQRIGWWRWLAYALLGLAVMTKGPVGLILPVGIMAGYHVLRGDWKEAWNYYTPLPGLLLVAAIAVPWFATEIYVTRGAYYQEFLVRENFQRFTSVVDHKGAWWYHIAAVAGGFLPWTIFAPQALFSAVRQKPRAAASAVPLFCSIWFLSVLVFFSVSVSKLLPYTLPAFPALALLVGIYLDTAIRAGKRLPILIPLAVLAVVCSAALYVVPGALTRMRELPPQLPHIIQSSLTALLDCSIAAGVVAALARTRWAIALFALLVFACFALYGSRTLDVISSEWEGPVPAFAQFASLSGEPIVVWHMRKPSITFYARRQVIIPLDEDSLRRVVDQEPRAYIIGKTADMPLLCSLSGCRVLVKQGRFVLLAKQPTAVH